MILSDRLWAAPTRKRATSSGVPLADELRDRREIDDIGAAGATVGGHNRQQAQLRMLVTADCPAAAELNTEQLDHDEPVVLRWVILVAIDRSNDAHTTNLRYGPTNL